MRVIYSDDYRGIAVEDRGCFWAVYERGHGWLDTREWAYKGYVLKMSEPRSSLVERCKRCISNHDAYRPMALGLDGLPIVRGAL